MSEAGTGQKTLGKYEIRGKLGRGAMGVVLDGWDPVIGRRVAIKAVPLMNSSDPEVQESLARFKREAQAAGRLTHPNVVAVFDYGETDTTAYIVMEFVAGQSLKERLDAGERFSVAETVRMMEQMLAALQYCHDRGVVHRDIKTANVMLTQEGQAKLADFGVARIEGSSLTQDGSIIGTPAYMSPEQLMGQPADARSDIYSAGVVLYQLLAAERPFDGSLASITHKVLNSVPPRPSEIALAAPPELDEVVARAMGRRPQERYQSASAFSVALTEAYRSLPTGTRATVGSAFADDATAIGPPGRTAVKPAPAPKPQAASRGGRSRLMAGVAVVLLLLVAGGAWYTLRQTPTPTEPQSIAANAPPAGGSSARGRLEPDAAQSAPAAAVAGAPTAVTSGLATSGGSASAEATGTTGQPAAVNPPEPAASPPTPQTTAAAAPTAPAASSTPSVTKQETAPSPAPTSQTPRTPPPSQDAPSRPVTVPGPLQAPPSPLREAANAVPIDPAALRMQLAEVARAVPCATPQFAVTSTGDVRVSGAVGSGMPDATLASAIKAAVPTTANLVWNTQAVPAAYCGMLDLLRPILATSDNTLALGLHADLRQLRENDPIRPDIRVNFPAYVQVDYLSSDGSITHLFPSRTGPDRITEPGVSISIDELARTHWEVGPPFGTDMIVAVASSVPLFTPRRLAAADTVQTYVPALQSAIEAAKRRDARLVAQIFVLKTIAK